MDNLEDKLLHQKLLEPWQLDRAKDGARYSGQSLWVNLVKLGFLSEKDIALFLAQESGIPYVKVSDYAIDQTVLHLVEENFCLQNRVIPLFRLENVLFVACGNPLDTAIQDTLAKMTGCVIEPLVSETHAILGALDLYWHLDEKNFELARFIIKKNAVQGVVQWRGADRLTLQLPFELKILDEAITLLSRRIITGNTFNISSDASALGAQTSIFLPQGIMVLLSLKIVQEQAVSGKLIELRGQIVRCEMIKAQQYLLAIRLKNASEAVKQELLDLAALK
jgi:hypothetical protein